MWRSEDDPMGKRACCDRIQILSLYVNPGWPHVPVTRKRGGAFFQAQAGIADLGCQLDSCSESTKVKWSGTPVKDFLDWIV